MPGSRNADWADAVRAANPKCAECDATKKLIATRIKPARLFPDEQFDVSNGMCLCPIHYPRHKESMRAPRVRGATGHKRTLEKRIKYLEARLRVKK